MNQNPAGSYYSNGNEVPTNHSRSQTDGWRALPARLEDPRRPVVGMVADGMSDGDILNAYPDL
jgi:hypothetical protein